MFITKFPQVAVLALLSTLLMVSSHEAVEKGLEKGADKLIRKGDTSFQRPYRRYDKLYNQCSGRHIQIIGQSVTAQGEEDSPFTSLRLESVHHHHRVGVNIIGERAGRFLCFNKKGKIIARFNGRNPRCLFREEISSDNMYTMWRSLYNPQWFVGFNWKGKPLNGAEYATTHRERCFYFIKRNDSYLNFHHHKFPGPDMPATDKLQDYLRQQRLKRRNARSHKKSKTSPSR